MMELSVWWQVFFVAISVIGVITLFAILLRKDNTDKQIELDDKAHAEMWKDYGKK